jgi:hypothetical protein
MSTGRDDPPPCRLVPTMHMRALRVEFRRRRARRAGLLPTVDPAQKSVQLRVGPRASAAPPRAAPPPRTTALEAIEARRSAGVRGPSPGRCRGMPHRGPHEWSSGVGSRTSTPAWKQLMHCPREFCSWSAHPLYCRKKSSRRGLAGLMSSQSAPHTRRISAAASLVGGPKLWAGFLCGQYLNGMIGRSHPQSPGPWSHGSSTMCRAVPASTVRFHQGQRWRT